MSKLTWATLPAEIIHKIVDYSLDFLTCCEQISAYMLISRHWLNSLRGMDYDTYKSFDFYDGPEYRLQNLDELNSLKRYLSTPYARERPVHKLVLEFGNDVIYEALRNQLDVILSKNLFNIIRICMSDDTDGDDSEESVPIRLPQSLKAHELGVSGSVQKRSILDWSSFNPFLKQHVRKLELWHLRVEDFTYENRLVNLQSLSMNCNTPFDDYSALVMNHSGIEYLNMRFDHSVEDSDEDHGSDEDDEDDEDREHRGHREHREHHPKLQLCRLNNLETLICNHELDFSSIECASLKHIILWGCNFPVSGWAFHPDRIETLHLYDSRPTASPSSPIWGNSDDFAGVEAIKQFKNLKKLHLRFEKPDSWTEGYTACKNISHFMDLFNRGEFDDCWPDLEQLYFCDSDAQQEASDRFFSRHPQLLPPSRIKRVSSFYDSWFDNVKPANQLLGNGA